MCCGIRTIQTIRQVLPLKVRETLVNALVLSHLQYSVLLMTGLTEQRKQQLNRQIRWAVKVANFRKKHDHVTTLMRNRGFLTMEGFLKKSTEGNFSLNCGSTNYQLFQTLVHSHFSNAIHAKERGYTVLWTWLGQTMSPNPSSIAQLVFSMSCLWHFGRKLGFFYSRKDFKNFYSLYLEKLKKPLVSNFFFVMSCFTFQLRTTVFADPILLLN